MINSSIHAFAGANTSEGFYSFFDYIIDNDKAKKIICLKGGPGTGKSSLMKKISKFFEDEGFLIEYFHCSSDTDSLDSIVIKDIGVCLVDGTAPHIRDPKNPGIIDEILNLGNYWDETSILPYKNEILGVNDEISDSFKKAYRYLKSAKYIHENWSYYNSKSINYTKLNKLEQELKNNIIPNKDYTNPGSLKRRFATAFSPQGIVTYADSLSKRCKNIYVLNGGPGTFKSHVLQNIGTEAYKQGYNVEFYHDTLIPSRIEHLMIPDLNAAILTSNEVNNKTFEGQQFYMDNILDLSVLNKYRTEIDENKKLFKEILDKALKSLKEFKSLHDKLEQYYINSMNFECINSVTNTLINQFLNYKK